MAAREVEPHFTVITMDGAPPEIVKAVQADASDDQRVIACAQKYLRKRTGAVHTWNSETKGFDRLPVLHVPQRRETVASPGEQGRRGRRASTSSRSSPDDPDPEPPPVEDRRGVEAASTRMVQRCERRRAKLAAP